MEVFWVLRRPRNDGGGNRAHKQAQYETKFASFEDNTDKDDKLFGHKKSARQGDSPQNPRVLAGQKTVTRQVRRIIAKACFQPAFWATEDGNALCFISWEGQFVKQYVCFSVDKRYARGRWIPIFESGRAGTSTSPMQTFMQYSTAQRLR
jgi:hypothetical protein